MFKEREKSQNFIFKIQKTTAATVSLEIGMKNCEKLENDRMDKKMRANLTICSWRTFVYVGRFNGLEFKVAEPFENWVITINEMKW